MANFTDYNTIIENKLANTSEIFYDAEMKREACNQAIEEILRSYDIPEMVVATHIVFSSTGSVSKPSDYFRMVKLWSSENAGQITAFADAGGGEVTVTSTSHGLSNGNIVRIVGTTSYNGVFAISDVTTNTFNIVDAFVADDATGSWTEGQALREYVYQVPDIFDSLADTASYYWTEDYVIDSFKLLAKPITSGVLNIRYIKLPTEMTDSTTDSGLSDIWNEVVAHGAVMRLFQHANRYDEAREHERLFKKRMAEIYLSVKTPGGVKQNNRFKSKYERISQLGINTQI